MGDSIFREEADKFRRAHTACRTSLDDDVAAAIREVGVSIAEAIIATGDARYHRERDESLIGELSGPGDTA